ncbi:TPA: oligosaccharide flippase family protein, partial [Escherichia coli]|nr:oligosaccharide flippase family protein [Escherichia coli]
MNKRILSNSIWMMSEKIISLFGLIFVTSFVAKYVGAEVFGQIAFATSLFQIAMIIAQLGSDVIIFKRVSKKIDSGVRLITSTIYLRAITYILIAIPIVIVSYEKNDVNALFFIIACAISCFFNAMDVFGIYYDARLESRKNTIINMLGLIISLSLRWLIAFVHLEPVYLCLPIILTGFIPCAFRWGLFRKEHQFDSIKLKHKIKYMKYLLVAGLTFVVSTISVAIYTRVSMLSLGFFYDKSIVGVFSIAVSLAASWSFVCNSLITSSLPSIFSEKNDNVATHKASKLNLLVVIISLPIILSTYAFGSMIINALYGEAYNAAYIPLMILSFSTMISSLGVISSRFIARYSGYAFLSKKMFAILIFSLA